jgi:hypothetical protein
MGAPGEGAFGFGMSLYCDRRALSTATMAGVKQSDFRSAPDERKEFPDELCCDFVSGECPAKRKEVRRLKFRLTVVVRVFGWRLTLTMTR